MDHDATRRAVSPVSSGRSSPSGFRARTTDEDLFKKDKGYRRYGTTVERVLALLDTAVEGWADYISFLSRLLKALASRPSGYTEIPHKQLVARRLSQCLNQTLPSSVHQQAIKVYSYIFSTIGSAGLSADLALYLPGLLPALTFASLSVKPNILKLYQDYIVHCTHLSLRPALKAVILSLLPCLEEENADEFEVTLRILLELQRAIRPPDDVGGQDEIATDRYFWQCIFLICMTTPSRRMGALAFLARHLPRLGPSPVPTLALPNGKPSAGANSTVTDSLQLSVLVVASPEPGLLLRCFCAGLQDPQLLVQRGFLDLLVTHVPLNSMVLQRMADKSDLQRLVLAATSVVLRRDMSLNRRLWSWFLGPEPTGEASPSVAKSPDAASDLASPHTARVESVQSAYYREMGLEPLVAGLSDLLSQQNLSAQDASRPLRICLSLMDRREIGGLLAPRLFLKAMQSVWNYQRSDATPQEKLEVLKSANTFFDGIESALIWSELTILISTALVASDTTQTKAQEGLDLALFIISNFNVQEEDMQLTYIPLTACFCLIALEEFLLSHEQDRANSRLPVINRALRISGVLLSVTSVRSFESAALDAQAVDSVPSNAIVLEEIKQGYVDSQSPSSDGPKLNVRTQAALIARSAVNVSANLLHYRTVNADVDYEAVASMLANAIQKTHAAPPDLNSLEDALVLPINGEDAVPNVTLKFSILMARAAVLEALRSADDERWLSPVSTRQSVPTLIRLLWPYLSPKIAKHNVEAARSIWRLQVVPKDSQLVESTITSALLSTQYPDGLPTLDDLRCFFTLWAQSPVSASSAQIRRTDSMFGLPAFESQGQASLACMERPLFLILDVLQDTHLPYFSVVVAWLQSLGSLLPLIAIAIERLMETPYVMLLQESSKSRTDREANGLPGETISPEPASYYIQTLVALVTHSAANVWPALAAPSSSDSENEDHFIHSNQDLLVSTCLNLLTAERRNARVEDSPSLKISQNAIELIRLLLGGPLASRLLDAKVDELLVAELASSIELSNYCLQQSLIKALVPALQLRVAEASSLDSPRNPNNLPKDAPRTASSLSIDVSGSEKRYSTGQGLLLPRILLPCLMKGLTSSRSRPVLDAWIWFLSQCLPLYDDGIFQVLLPLTSNLCKTLYVTLNAARSSFESPGEVHKEASDSTMALLLNALERTLATAHDCLATEEAASVPSKSPEQQQTGFFGNMVSGVFAGDAGRMKNQAANSRLTVLLCFKDAIRVCFSIWSWGDTSQAAVAQDAASGASFNFMTVRLKNRTRRIFENLLDAEALESLETLVDLWQGFIQNNNEVRAATILNLLNGLDSSRPKNTIPAIFNAIYSRTNPAALDPSRKSTLTTSLSDSVLAAFLVSYVRSLEDDAMDEIWTDCITFLRDVLSNPLPNRQILTRLLEFITLLGIKVDNTTFGEQRKMRRDLGDLYARFIAASLTTKAIGSTPEPGSEKGTDLSRKRLHNESLLHVLAEIVPDMPKVILEPDRIASAATTISAQVLGPLIKAKTFPATMDAEALDVVTGLSRLSEAAKVWKKDVTDMFNDARFFSHYLPLVESKWMSILRSWALADKERMPELLSRITTPTAAGIMFGVGATSARLEADRRTQLNLRRIATLILASPEDTFVASLEALQDKLVELMGATASSSPSINTRAEVYMVIRALVLKTSPIHLAAFWSTINAELTDTIAMAFPAESGESYNPICMLQACKLLDMLIALNPDDFQLSEWLFISDTTDAEFRPPGYQSTALIDELAEELSAMPSNPNASTADDAESRHTKKRPLLAQDTTREIEREEITPQLLQPFFRQLSIYAFECTYAMQTVDQVVCEEDLLKDIFNERTLV